MARAASDAATDAATEAASSLLRRVFFLQPLLLDGDVAPLRVVCELNAAEERFEVRSEFTEEGASTAHCGGSTGAARRTTSGGARSRPRCAGAAGPRTCTPRSGGWA